MLTCVCLVCTFKQHIACEIESRYSYVCMCICVSTLKKTYIVNMLYTILNFEQLWHFTNVRYIQRFSRWWRRAHAVVTWKKTKGAQIEEVEEKEVSKTEWRAAANDGIRQRNEGKNNKINGFAMEFRSSNGLIHSNDVIGTSNRLGSAHSVTTTTTTKMTAIQQQYYYYYYCI